MKKHAPTSQDAAGLRRRAEQRLRQRRGRKARSTPDPGNKRAIQELQIHQIELELQNEELIRAKAEVDAGLEKYTDLYDSAPVGYFSLDADGLILELNLTGATLLGRERSRLTKRRFQLVVAPSSRPTFGAFLQKVFAGRETQSCEVQLLHHNRSPFWAVLEATPVPTVKGTPASCRLAVSDISVRRQAEEAQRRLDDVTATNANLQKEIIQRRHAEAALRASERRAHELLEQSHKLQIELRHLSHEILLVQENQRRDISRKLHDEISQLLVGINVHLAIFTREAAVNPQGIQRSIAPVRQLVEKAVQAVHQFARELRPPMLDELGLVPALRAYLKDLPKRKGQKMTLTASGSVEALNNDKRTALYRIAQEALTNVTKYARARVVTVSLREDKGVVHLEVADNGIGFDLTRMASAAWSNHLGLIGMRERMEMIGGRFSIASAPGQGTTIRAEVPFGEVVMLK